MKQAALVVVGFVAGVVWLWWISADDTVDGPFGNEPLGHVMGGRVCAACGRTDPGYGVCSDQAAARALVMEGYEARTPVPA